MYELREKKLVLFAQNLAGFGVDSPVGAEQGREMLAMDFPVSLVYLYRCFIVIGGEGKLYPW
jgi:hypothetical protein